MASSFTRVGEMFIRVRHSCSSVIQSMFILPRTTTSMSCFQSLPYGHGIHVLPLLPNIAFLEALNRSIGIAGFTQTSDELEGCADSSSHQPSYLNTSY